MHVPKLRAGMRGSHVALLWRNRCVEDLIGVGDAGDDRPGDAKTRRVGEDSDRVEMDVPKRRHMGSEGMPLAIMPVHGARPQDKNGTRDMTEQVPRGEGCRSKVGVGVGGVGS